MATPDDRLKTWGERPLNETPSLFWDARYEKVRLEGHIVDRAVLITIGIDASGKCRVLCCEIAPSEAESNWRRFLDGLLARGLKGVALGGFRVFAHHFSHQFFERDFGGPAECFPCFASIAQQGFDFGEAEVSGIDGDDDFVR